MTEDPAETFTLATRDEATGERHETEMTAEQTLDFVAAARAGEFHALAYFPTDEQLVADEDGELVQRESAIPRRADPREDSQ